MTVLYRLDAPAAAIAKQFAARSGDDPWAGGLVSPGTFAPVVTSGREFIAGPRPNSDPPRRLIPRLWGVPPPPAADPRSSGVLTVRNPDSPLWIGNLRNAEFRCLVPATAFMVWGKGVDRDGKRRRHWFAPADQPLFALAGVWTDSEIPSFALLTCESNALLRAAGRETMPVILPASPGAQAMWLTGEWKRASAMLVPYASSLMREA
jgi:putative SOS response-associated peptidase YedK